jgi:ArsR family transcriptional regulator
MNRDLSALDLALKAMADPTRARIVSLLSGGEVCVCHIHETLKITQTKTSRHLAYLRRAGLVTAEKRGLWVYYRLAAHPHPVVRTACEAVRHCIAHMPRAQRDAERLTGKTGTAVSLPPKPSFSCCGTRARRHTT